MNRRILFAILAVGSLTLVATGCEKKNTENKGEETTTTTAAQDQKLTCTLTEDEEGYKEETKFVYTYKEGKLSFVTLQGTMIYKDKYDEKTATKLGDECNADLKDQKGVTCNVQKTGSRIYVTYQYTINKLDDKGWKLAEEAGIKEVKDFNFDKLKSTMEAATFTCK